MKKIGVILLTGFSIFLAPMLRAQSEDPSEVFLKAYMTAQQGEKLEHENNFRDALAKFRFAGGLLEELRKRHADWQPAIVEYRSRKISESILRVEGKAATQKDFNASAPSTAGNIASPPLPERSTTVEPNVELLPVRPSQDRAATASNTPPPPSDAVIQEATRKLRGRVEDLEAQLEKSRSELTTAQKEKETVATQLQETNTRLAQAQEEVEKTKQAERDVRDQLGKAQDSLGKLESSGKSDGKAQVALRDEIAQLKKALASAEAGKTSAEKEKDAANAQLTDATKQLASVKMERDTAIAQLKGSKEAQDHVQVLVAENCRPETETGECGKDRARNRRRQAEEGTGNGRREEAARTIASAARRQPETKSGFRSHDRGFAFGTG